MAKLTFLEFLKYREKLLSLLNDNERDKSEIEKEYIVIQEELLSNDLSDIDAFWWSDIEIACGENYIADFSKTNANIDFSKLPYSDYCNYKSCNISNFPKDRLFNASHFDSKYDNGYSFIHDIIDDADKFKMMNKIFTLKDYNRLSSEQKEEINRLDYKNCFDSKDLFFIDIFGLDKMSEYSNLYPNEYKCVKDVLTKEDLLSQHFYKHDSMIDNIKSFKKEIIERSNNNIDDYTEAFYHYIKKLFNGDYTTELIDLSLLSKDFIDKNSDMILPSEKIPQDLLERYNNRTLTIDDIVDNFDIFKTIYFVPYLQPEHRSLLSYLFGVIGKNLEKFINDEEAFKYVLCSGKKYIELFTNQIAGNVININFDTFLRDFIHKNDQIEIPQQLMHYEPDLFELDSRLKMIVDILGLDNIKMFEKETGYFSHRRYDNSSPMENIKMLEDTLSREYIVKGLKQQGIDFKDGTLSYDEFKNQFAKFLNYLRSTNVYADYQDYRCIDGEFREQHKEFFIDKSAPDDIQKLFYRGCRIDDLVHTPEALKYLEEVDLSHTIRAKINMNIAIPATGGEYLVVEKDFIQEYLSKYGKKKLLDLLMKYGYLLDNTSIPNYKNEFDNEEELDKVIRNVLYEKIIKNYPRYNIRYYSKSDLNHEYLRDIPLFVQEHPDLFIDLDGLNIPEPVRIQITNDFYNRTMRFDFVKQYPELVDVLKDKNLELAFWNSDNSISGLRTNDNKSKDFYKDYSDYDYIKLLGNENFLKLCAKYGRYLSKTANIVGRKIDLKQHPTYEDVDKVLEEVVYENCCTHVVEYSPLDAPEFLKEQHPELFLAEDAPDALKKHFYYSGGDLSTTSDYPLDFYLLQSHKEWTPYLKDKDLFVPLSRNKSIRNSILKAKEKFGDKIIQIGTAKPETITRMLDNNKVDLMYQWWQKTGCKFVPDFVVMNNFKLEEADKFLDSSQQWKKLGKIEDFSSNIDAREAMLKIAYSFGVFDHDQRGIKKTIVSTY